MQSVVSVLGSKLFRQIYLERMFCYCIYRLELNLKSLSFIYKQIWLTFIRDALSSLTYVSVMYLARTVNITIKDLFLSFPPLQFSVTQAMRPG